LASARALRIDFGLAIHGGVGTLTPAALTPELEAEYRAALERSLRAGFGALRSGGSALDATVEAVGVMEDSPLFNAGRGSNFDERGVITMDASIMDGSTGAAGAVAHVATVRSPVRLARLVMDQSPHVLLVGEGAEHFARVHGVKEEDAAYFYTDRRWDALQVAKAEAGARPNVLGDSDGDESVEASPSEAPDPTSRSGTVGAVALDGAGRLAAATSTGGMANKTWGRVGDSPIIGAGTFASHRCAVSCTGWGEHFITNAVAHDVHARMEHADEGLAAAVRGIVFERLHRKVPGSGGLVALDADGNVELSFNTRGMYRGWIGEDGSPNVAIYAE